MKKSIIFVLVLMCVFVLGCGGEKPVACTEDAKICPDGTAVGRVPPDCEFAPCPVVEMGLEEAIAIAQDSECVEKGELTEESFYNQNTKTWWIDLDMRPEFEEEYCNPACVVSEETKTAEINWRCTGLITP